LSNQGVGSSISAGSKSQIATILNLDAICVAREGQGMRTTPYLAAAASAALLALAGCNNDPVSINTVERDANAPTEALPSNVAMPMIAASKIYRCAYPSNAVFYIDFYDNNTAAVRAGNANATPTRLTGTSAAGPFTANGMTVSGSGNQITINGQSCRARS